MTESSSSRELAAAIVERALAAVAEGKLNHWSGLELLDDSGLRRLLEVRGASLDAVSWQTGVSRLAVALAREVVPVWISAYPDNGAPVVALEAAEAWARCPCAVHAEAAAAAQPEAVAAFGAVWHVPPREAAWAGRTAAWAADAPKHGWQALAAIDGACRATSVERVLGAAARFVVVEGGVGGVFGRDPG